MINPYYFIGPNPTVDLIVINPSNEILLIKRGPNTNACPNMWALPGGFIDTIAKQGQKWLPGLETPKDAAIREVLEETNLNLINPDVSFIGIFEGNQRDPRDNEISWSRSHAFLHIIPSNVYESQKNNLRGMDDACDVSWKSYQEISTMNLAFDHNKIIDLALELIPNNNKKFKP